MILIPKEKYERLMEMNEKIQETNMKDNGQPENTTEENKDLQTDVTPRPDNTITSETGVNTDAKHVVLTPEQFQRTLKVFKPKKRTSTPPTFAKKWLKL